MFLFRNRFINERAYLLLSCDFVMTFFFSLLLRCNRVHNKGFRNLSSTTKGTLQYILSYVLVLFFYEQIVHALRNLFKAICHRNENNVFHKSGNCFGFGMKKKKKCLHFHGCLLCACHCLVMTESVRKNWESSENIP